MDIYPNPSIQERIQSFYDRSRTAGEIFSEYPVIMEGEKKNSEMFTRGPPHAPLPPLLTGATHAGDGVVHHRPKKYIHPKEARKIKQLMREDNMKEDEINRHINQFFHVMSGGVRRSKKRKSVRRSSKKKNQKRKSKKNKRSKRIKR